MIMRSPQTIPGPTSSTAATMIAPPRRGAALPPPPPVYYDLEEPIHRRPVWPWIAALLFVIGAGIGGWFLYSQISNKLASNQPVPVELYLNMREAAARAKISADGFRPVVNTHSSRTTPAGLVFRQQPNAGERIAKGNPVTIWVSTGVPKVAVPSLVDTASTDAVAALKDAHLTPDVHEVPSSKDAGIVTAQDPPAGTKLPEGSKVRINVSKGPTPVSVPNVIGQPIASASSILQGLQFKVTTNYVDSTDPANTVIDQSPAANQSAPKGSAVTLTVSKGPTTSTVPDVTSLDAGSAQQALSDAGFRPRITYRDVVDPSQEGIVLEQSPGVGTQAKPGSNVTIAIGRYTGGGTTTDAIPTP
jgi:serine/threonine-protein kinase